MNDHESALTENLKNQLLEENKKLSEELFNKQPLHKKILDYGFAITLVAGVLFFGYLVYRISIVVIPRLFSH